MSAKSDFYLAHKTIFQSKESNIVLTITIKSETEELFIS